ncbi:MAG: hypothetical protein UW37_C0017G0007 [Candidatus Gottesmanbacteria bacterium GW2011_GWA2_44_17]|uniref:DUF2207 domain-containing protein n=3 Tax=Candidatus Gottesmaniibacteriota TaxID=1752720 RepID=A0A0G1KWC4_9BACT|nr:MAG: hypothetical protein UV63_C0024G0009 [Microgenomates group bacterium GW2011_GWC1_43_11]KKT37512.1 MAG: hypothetical protein UW22_C0025G0007 [Candidatus Gottesmanbacteria bacterium GW2011_GWB1_44_11c]KKT46836.1 MAG: hypothetical protein UW37_C0017G0007 [Candidatus Gottesmanbacteria bacterium GW2011_GWA2_44_17]KKT60592.1 MAG: hypothetical protein UW52_C0022G0006 [Candidatus Gottesmanbacteria bacterium GW2011_GWA1_44_24b]
MKKLLLFFTIVCALAFFPITTLRAEEISSFDGDISIQKDGSFTVSENILYDFGTHEKHGIYRTIPYEKINTEGKRFRMDMGPFSVIDPEGKPYQFTQSTEGQDTQLKIGSPNVLVREQKTYIIRYTVKGGLTYFSDHDELYWQVTGTDWQVPIQKASLAVSLPGTIDQTQIRMTCYTGSRDSSASDCSTAYTNGRITISSDTMLSSREGMTVVVGFPKNLVAVLEPKPVNTWLSDLIVTIVRIVFALFSIGWYLILPVWIVVHWFRTGRDPKPPMGVASAWFDVPKTDKEHRLLTPGETGTLIDEKADMREITATIVDLARRGYLKIIEKKKRDFYLEKRNAVKKEDTLVQFEKTLYDGIFFGEDPVRIKDADSIDTVSKTKKQLYDAVVQEKFFVSNPESVRTKYSIIGGLALFTMNFPLALSSFIFGRAMPKKTVSGAQNAAVAQSLKNFITSQERQYTYQAKNQIFFEKFLPYAIAFGVEKIWADRFKDIKLTKPDWYDGYDMQTFNSVYFISSLNSSMHSFSSAATPTRSSSGFSSGFSGGSVGGGGGGGGGGSW